MAEKHRTGLLARRQPLSEVKNRANTPPVHARHVKAGKLSSPSPQNLPHNESLEPNGSLAIRGGSDHSSPRHKRIVHVADDRERNTKRDSAVSAASTNASGRRRKTYIGHWQLGKTIGKGGCSRVRVVRHKTSNQYGAVKIITRTTAENTRAQSLANLIESTRALPSTTPGHRPIPYGLEREIAVMKLLEHPNIVRLYDVWENRNELYLIMEYVDGGELFHYIDERKGLHEDETVYIFRQIVSALLYCHRLLICHRDLKPENILLKDDLTVKLIDFGMAALQPEGRLLSTPCGSPHYAAPEVVSSRPYDGTQADVWSCGVILYVMLTGTTPYNYPPDGDIRNLFKDISRAHYWMPSSLSHEAKDLIRRIFVPDPKKRITMDEVWEHPLLHKYDEELGYEGEAGTKEAAIGPTPKVTDFKLKRIQDIDVEILRNMRTLWHSEAEKSLIQKLLSNDINQEKLFYAALVKHREENLENYAGAEDMGYSNSDYHHTQAYLPADAPPMPPVQAPRSQSQYSIMNDEHLRPSHSFVEPTPSISSYDPYRASKSPMVDGKGEYVNVTVHRNGSSSNRRLAVQRSLRHPNSLRIETLKHSNRRVSDHSSSSLARSGPSRSSLKPSSISRPSMTSSGWPSSPPVIAKMRPSDLHKRGVNFGHIRRTSTTSALASQDSDRTPPTPSLPSSSSRDRHAHHATDRSAPGSSPIVHVEQAIRSRKEKAQLLETPRIKVRKADTPSQHIRNDIRKHSAELEKACEEAFFRSSVGSSLTAHTMQSEKNGPFDTPPSSVSPSARGGSGTLDLLEPKYLSRPLPQLPKDTPTTYLTKTLAETRDKLAAYKLNGEDNSEKFEEVMKMLEHIMPTAGSSSDKRAASAPDSKVPDHLGFLPIISEETEQRNGKTDRQRSVTAPSQREKLSKDRTVRVVPISPSGAVAPLNVRKRSNGSETNSSGSQSRLSVKTSSERLGQRWDTGHGRGLAVIEEDSTLPSTPAQTPTVGRKKKSRWFGLNNKTPDHEKNHTGTSSTVPFDGLDDRKGRQVSKVLIKHQPDKPLPMEPPPSAQSSEFPIRKKKSLAGKKSFSRWLGKMGGDKDESSDQMGETTMHTSMDSLFSSASPGPSSDESPPSVGPERSWFARFFHIKPATRIVCFSIPRGRARQELVLLLKEWQRHGIRDLQYSRECNSISARVDRENALDIKPVSFRIELFVVLEHGRKVGLSIARFVQTKGAASGFKRVLEVVDGVMRGRGWLVEDEEKWKALCEVIGG